MSDDVWEEAVSMIQQAAFDITPHVSDVVRGLSRSSSDVDDLGGLGSPRNVRASDERRREYSLLEGAGARRLNEVLEPGAQNQTL